MTARSVRISYRGKVLATYPITLGDVATERDFYDEALRAAREDGLLDLLKLDELTLEFVDEV